VVLISEHDLVVSHSAGKDVWSQQANLLKDGMQYHALGSLEL
jgi:hypothetical protein